MGYEAALDRDCADDRGIVSGFLFRTDRVRLMPASPGDPVLGADPGVEYRAPGKPSSSRPGWPESSTRSAWLT